METRVHLGTGGRLVLPAMVRRELGLRPGDELVLVVEPGAIRLLTVAEAARRAQRLVAKYVDPGESLADQLVAERREEDRVG
ncbi:MAG TPA: AbrB/MazE/SpoVT family DNA-binding domain-containing protein [Acidobacteria bacterium]|nr:AbrB/MazE/SpoVT family DNA-binding domain-containing protein [Acidobacteriota bacterium]